MASITARLITVPMGGYWEKIIKSAIKLCKFHHTNIIEHRVLLGIIEQQNIIIEQQALKIA
jgi:hypothetical protein